MPDKNMAKEWQKGWYQIHVGDSEIAIRTKRNGVVWERYAECRPDDEFSLSEGVKIAMERLEKAINPDTIKVGDKVRIKCSHRMYCNYIEWIIDNVIVPEDIACWQYGNNLCDMNGKYLVKYIGLNKYTNEMMAYIVDIGNGKGYLFGIDSLEKINE